MTTERHPHNSTARLAAVIAVTLASTACAPSRTAPEPAQSVVLVSIDGFRSEYLDWYEAPHLKALAARGVRARWLEPSFPVLTFPNHYTIVTGLVPARHGVVANRMRDASGARFQLSDSAAVGDSRWWGGEPLWVTAERSGVRSGTFFWPGSEAEIGGIRPTFWKSFRDDVPLADRVDTVLAWLTRPDSLRPRLVTVYLSNVDHAGHDFGPRSAEARAAVLAADSAIGRLTGGLAAHGVAGRVNVVVVSDHGMAETNVDRVVILDDLIDRATIDAVETGATIMINPLDGDTGRVLRALRASPRLQVYRADSLPVSWRFQGQPRIPAVVGVPDAGWLLLSRRTFDAFRAARSTGGTHGYQPADTSMHALFIAAGPAFRQGRVVAPFGNTHVYQLLCAVLGLPPAPNDGSLDSVRTMLR